VSAGNVYTFLVGWEGMALTSFLLVLGDGAATPRRHAAILYLVMTHVASVFVTASFFLIARDSGSTDFAAMSGAEMSPAIASLAFLLALAGFGTKAGLIPAHIWLPRAHPVAPSHVSALMSGVMTKVAVYGFVRIVFDLVGDPAWWWGAVVMVLGAITALLGVLHALMQHDLKRLLAYHTVENIGIIFIGLGLALAFQANGLIAAAALGLTAALFHVLNHSLFKSLLFFGAGAVLSSTGTRDMERLGGLIHVMPWTAGLFILGSVAISALPPLNGFVSEWLTLQAIFASPDLPQWVLRFAAPAVGAMLALSAALAATCFVKACGIVLLGRPRSAAAAAAREADGYQLAAMGALGALCVLAGLAPGVVIDGLAAPVALLTGAAIERQADWLMIVPLTAERSAYSGLITLLCLAAT
ncbi:MAG: proton-conducting transporter membrane subunit, partial [Pseudomonadota bacterium]